MDDLSSVADESFCYVTTTGRRTGRPHEIEIWFGWSRGATIYLLAGGRGRSDWVRNIWAHPEVMVRIGQATFPATGREVGDPAEEALARRLLAAKYQGWQQGEALSGWAETALPIALELDLSVLYPQKRP